MKILLLLDVPVIEPSTTAACDNAPAPISVAINAFFTASILPCAITADLPFLPRAIAISATACQVCVDSFQITR